MEHGPTRRPAPTRPVVAIVADRTAAHGHDAHAVLHLYVRAVARAAGAMPLIVPADEAVLDASTLLASVDGLLLPGSPSNVEPARYGGAVPPAGMLTDPARDAVVFGLWPAVLAAGVPVLAICRGLQELNVAQGGTLDIAVHERADRLDHREGDRDRPFEQWFEDSHAVDHVADGLLARVTGVDAGPVNSLHHQGIDRLGQGLSVEARAPDGLVEAFTVAQARAFALAVQWHPEARIDDCESARRIFAAFGEACRARMRERLA